MGRRGAQTRAAMGPGHTSTATCLGQVLNFHHTYGLSPSLPCQCPPCSAPPGAASLAEKGCNGMAVIRPTSPRSSADLARGLSGLTPDHREQLYLAPSTRDLFVSQKSPGTD